MKYMLLNDWKFIFSNYKKYIVLFLLVILSYSFCNVFMKESFDYQYLYSVMGLNANYSDVLSFVLFLFHISFFCFIGISLFTNDLRNSKGNLLLRLKMNKWFVGKVLSILSLVLFFEIVGMIIGSIFVLVNSTFTWKYLSVFIAIILFVGAVVSTFILGYISKLFFLLFLLFVYLINGADYKIVDISYWIWGGLLVFNVIIGNYLIVMKKSDVFEECV